MSAGTIRLRTDRSRWVDRQRTIWNDVWPNHRSDSDRGPVGKVGIRTGPRSRMSREGSLRPSSPERGQAVAGTLPARTLTGTHWEFFVACREAGLDDDRIDTLRRLTETYERAAFSPRTVSETSANWVVEAAAAVDGSVDAG